MKPDIVLEEFLNDKAPLPDKSYPQEMSIIRAMETGNTSPSLSFSLPPRHYPLVPLLVFLSLPLSHSLVSYVHLLVQIIRCTVNIQCIHNESCDGYHCVLHLLNYWKWGCGFCLNYFLPKNQLTSCRVWLWLAFVQVCFKDSHLFSFSKDRCFNDVTEIFPWLTKKCPFILTICQKSQTCLSCSDMKLGRKLSPPSGKWRTISGLFLYR